MMILKKTNLRELFEIQHTKHPRHLRIPCYLCHLTDNQYFTNVFQPPRFSIILSKTTRYLEKSPLPLFQ